MGRKNDFYRTGPAPAFLVEYPCGRKGGNNLVTPRHSLKDPASELGGGKTGGKKRQGGNLKIQRNGRMSNVGGRYYFASAESQDKRGVCGRGGKRKCVLTERSS